MSRIRCCYVRGAVPIAGCLFSKSAHFSARAPTTRDRSHREALLLPSLSLLAERLFKRFDEKSTGNIDYEEFLNGGCVGVQACSPTGPMWGKKTLSGVSSLVTASLGVVPLVLRNSHLFLARLRCMLSLLRWRAVSEHTLSAALLGTWF